MNEKYSFGTKYLTLSQGSKNQTDYIIKWNGTQQFTDKDLFDLFSNMFKNKEEAVEFIKNIKKVPHVSFTNNCIETNFTKEKREQIYNYIDNIDKSEDYKLALFSVILRCDIDNNSYNCPRFNGCIRHFMQIILFLGYYFNIDEFKNIYNKKLPVDNIAKTISDIGYPGNKYGINSEHWKEMYKNFINNL